MGEQIQISERKKTLIENSISSKIVLQKRNRDHEFYKNDRVKNSESYLLHKSNGNLMKLSESFFSPGTMEMKQ